MDFEKEIPVEDFDTDFDTKELTPIKSLRSDPPAQYFTNIDGKYCKDVAGREELDELKAIVDDVPWQPLEDGYSNFWFELTDDTLSPWLNFSAKNNDATIDWGDGSGEVALDTLTPTHTYGKAGKYVVKVKGVTGLADCNAKYGSNSNYYSIIKNVECNSEITSLGTYAFRRCLGVEHITFTSNISLANSENLFIWCVNLRSINAEKLQYFGYYCTGYCALLRELSVDVVSIGGGVCNTCVSLRKLTMSSKIESIGNSAFTGCLGLNEIHCQATTPPTLGTNVFSNTNNSFIIYVPVGYGDTYKSATGWSDYADHILEEGQTPNRMMLAKFNRETDEPQDDMR